MIINPIRRGGGDISTVLTVTADNGSGSAGITVTASNGETDYTGVFNSQGIVWITVAPGYDYTVSESSGIAEPVTVHVDAEGASVILNFPFGCTIVAIDESVADPYARCSYPTSVTINGKTYTNSIPSSGFIEARGTSLNSWAERNACSKLIEGIRPVARSGSTWVTEGYSLTDSTGWSSSYDWFTEFPFRWMAWYKADGIVYILFSDNEENPDSAVFQDYAFLNNSNVRQPNMHIGCFDGTVTSNVLYSKRTNAKPWVGTVAGSIAFAKARGTGFDIITYYQAMYVIGLFVTLYKTTDCQGYSNPDYGLGKGYVEGDDKQNIIGLSFDNNFGMYGDRSSTTSRVSFFWLHDLWGNVATFVGGAKMSIGSTQSKFILQIGKISSTKDSDFNVNTDLTNRLGSLQSGFCTSIDGGQKTGPFPLAIGGSATTYYPDYCSASSEFPVWGGYYSRTGYAGLFSWLFQTSATGEYSTVGTRLSYKGGRT